MDISVDSIFALPIFPPTWSLVSTSSDTTHSYSWVGKGGKLAIAEMSFDTLGMPNIFKWTELPGIGVGVEETMEVALNVFPNPAQSTLSVTADSKWLGETITVVDVCGKIVHREIMTSTTTQINLEHFSSGSYVLHLGPWKSRWIKP
jgi:hypothetical protein